MKIRCVLFFLLACFSIPGISQIKVDSESIQDAINQSDYTKALELINHHEDIDQNEQLLLFKADVFTILNQKDSAYAAIKRCRQLFPYRPHYMRNANYYYSFLNYAVKFNQFADVDRITRLYMAEPIGMMQRSLRRYPQHAHLIPALNNMATGYYIHLAYLDAIGHPARFDAYENSRLYDEDEYDYEEWFGNVEHFYLTGKWNRRAYQSIASAKLKNKLPQIEAYDNLLTFNQGRIYLDMEFDWTSDQLQVKLDSIEAILTDAYPLGSQPLTDAYLKRILYHKDKNESKTSEYFKKVANNKLEYYRDIFPSLNYEEQRSAYALDTLFFDYFFQESIPRLESDIEKYEDLLFYSSTWKNYLLLSERRDLLQKQSINLKNKQAIVDIIRFSDQGKSKYAITIFSNKLLSTEVLSADPIENKAYKLLSNQVKYKLPISESLLEQFFGSAIEKLKSEGIKEIYFVPDGIYHLINPGTLIDPESGNYLTDIFDIKQRLHVYAVNQGVSKLDKNENAIFFGNPRFNQLKTIDIDRGVESMVTAEFSQLPGTEAEVRHVSNLLANDAVDVQLFIDTLATETRVKASVNQADILHIATHGFFLTAGSGFEKNRYSGLVLSRDAQNDGILYAHEIRQLPKTKASLIVLSACESSLGELSIGEGIAGLKSALKGVGADGLILSYWKVNDEATSYFMKTLYAYIQKNKDYESALKSAVRDIKKKYPSPYYWGAFDYQR
ncbi:CHAT domain-containing protein [Reichenbachiella sp.]|uniref:CHAT domain-containing protein n=1 Tax=Reichenbachiella sp. TaxID=2184521 RepID=UPI003BB04FF2